MGEITATIRLKVPEDVDESMLKEEIEQALFNHLDTAEIMSIKLEVE